MKRSTRRRDIRRRGPWRRGISRRQDDDGAACELGVEHVVYPSNGGNAVETGAIYAAMLTMVSPTGISAEEAPGLGVLFWRVVLTSKQATKVKETAGVAFVYVPCKDDCYDPTTEDIVMQPDAGDDLTVVGQFNGESLEWYKDNYVYHSRAGESVSLYILDNGANLEHKVSQSSQNGSCQFQSAHSSCRSS